jgi:deoxycytidylate deaminase
MKKRYTIIATTFDKKGNILGSGVNDYNKSHPLMKLYALKAGESELKIKKHAELAAILAAGNKDIHRIFVQRFTEDGEYALAMPCKTCQTMIKDFGIKVVEFTTPEGIIRM